MTTEDIGNHLIELDGVKDLPTWIATERVLYRRFIKHVIETSDNQTLVHQARLVLSADYYKPR